MIDDVVKWIKILRKSYHTYGVNHKLSRAKEKIRSGDSKLNDFCSKASNWIKQEIKK